jgi:acyl-[acyl carrier protein]--UDP-N-acetylglucosamine O-acyltransferase
MVGSGSVVTRDIPDYGLAWGNPARLHGFVCPCGQRLVKVSQQAERVTANCPYCGQTIDISLHTWESAA